MRLINSCCLCVNLKRGTVIIGLLGIISSLIVLILLFTTSIKFKTIAVEVSPLAAKIINVFDLLLWIAISILLIVGAYKRNIWFMVPWLILSMILNVGFLISLIYTSVIDFVNEQTYHGVMMLLSGLITIAFFVYTWIVVYSYCEEIRLKRRGEYY